MMNENKGRVFALSDIHGRLDVFNEVLQFLKPEDQVFFLGDACDRGSKGWTIVKAILADPRFTYIKGNHEDMLASFLRDPNDFSREKLCYINGGAPTMESALADPNCKEIGEQLGNLPYKWMYKNEFGRKVMLTHAGCDGDYFDSINEEDAIWDRSHYLSGESWWGDDNTIMVHGHTPIIHMVKDMRNTMGDCDYLYMDNPMEVYSAYRYCKRHKINIDALTAYTGRAILLDLDTFQSYLIDVGMEEK